MTEDPTLNPPAPVPDSTTDNDEQVRYVIDENGGLPRASPNQRPPDKPSDTAQPGPADRGRIIASVALVLAVLLVLSFGAWWMSSGRKPTPQLTTTVTVTQTVTAATTTSQSDMLSTDPPVARVVGPLSLPLIPALPTTSSKVKGDGIDIPGVQKLANDIAANDVDKIVTNCWTQPESEVRLVYGSDAMRGAVLQALTVQPIGAQGGLTWVGQYVTVSALWEELYSLYTCASVSWDTNAPGLGSFTPAMAAWRMTRILAIQDGVPLHIGDGIDYMLVCNADCRAAWAPHDAGTPYDPNGRLPILDATANTWAQLRYLSEGPITVEQLSNGYYRVRSTDGSTPTLAYFTGTLSDYWLPYLLGEVA